MSTPPDPPSSLQMAATTPIVTSDMSWLPTDDTPLADAALAYATHELAPVVGVHCVREENGKLVCGCGSRNCAKMKRIGKHPVGEDWPKRATMDVDTIRDLWTRQPWMHIGLLMGGTGRLLALDVDGPVGRESLAQLEAEHGALPETLTSSTGRVDGGEHRIFRLPVGFDIDRIGNKTSFRDGLDIKAKGGQIVAAPSMHASGTRYRWTNRTSPADLPEWLFDIIASPLRSNAKARSVSDTFSTSRSNVSPYLATTLRNAVARIASMREGGRNQLLFAKATTVFEYFVGEKLDHAAAWADLASAGTACGLPKGEVHGVLTKAWNQAQKNPRFVPASEPRTAAPRAAQPTTPPAALAAYPTAEEFNAEVAAEDAARALAHAEANPDDSWRQLLTVTNEGMPKKGIGNVLTILSCDPRWVGVLAYDAFAESIVKTRVPPRRPQDQPKNLGDDWTDEDTVCTSAWIEREFHFEAPIELINKAISTVARRTIIHPVRDYLQSLKWDGIARLDTWLTAYFRCVDTEYSRGVGSRWCISAVARVFDPGCQADCALILESKRTVDEEGQGVGKSTGLKLLCPKREWFGDTHIVMGDKDSYQMLRRKWIYELGEMGSVKGKDKNRVKNFVSASSDNYRPSYGSRTRDFLRQVVFAGTTNEEEYFDDRTGNRRFWPILVGVLGHVDRDMLLADRDQLWAEATHRYLAGEKWHVDTPQFRNLCLTEQEARLQQDPWDSIIAQWLLDPRIEYFDAQFGATRTRMADIRDGVNPSDVMLGALKKQPGAINRGDQMRVADSLRACGYYRAEERTTIGTTRVRLFVRKPASAPPNGGGTPPSGTGAQSGSPGIPSKQVDQAGLPAASAGMNTPIGRVDHLVDLKSPREPAFRADIFFQKAGGNLEIGKPGDPHIDNESESQMVFAGIPQKSEVGQGIPGDPLRQSVPEAPFADWVDANLGNDGGNDRGNDAAE